MLPAMDTWMYGLIGASSVLAVAALFVVLFYVVVLVRTLVVRHNVIKRSLTATAAGWASKKRHRLTIFTFHQLKKYSECFSNRVGSGTTNYVYKGILPDDTEVAIKQAKEEVAHSADVEGRFCFQVQLLSRVYHHHLVNLVGICNEKNHQMLVFQYAPNGTLYENLHVHEGEEFLSWKQRMRIAVGLASGLAYLHHTCDPPVIHGDFRSCHVFLTEDYAAKIGGLGKIPIVASSELAVVRKKGGAVDPETVQKGVYSRAGDVYSFGVLLLELVSGRLTYSEELGLLVDWAARLAEEEATMEMLEERLRGRAPPAEVALVAEVAAVCVQREANSRPTMPFVEQMLQQGLAIAMEAAAPSGSHLTLRGLLNV